MATNSLEDIKLSSAEIVIDAGLLHSIVHGGSTDPDVVTEGGDVKPVAKVIAEAQAALAAAVGTVGTDILNAAAAALAAATAAAASATTASTGASAATTAATNAASSATAAAASATTASTAATAASSNATTATTAATNAAASATAAATSATNAANSATAAAASAAAAAASAAAASSGTSLGTTAQSAGNNTITPTNGNHVQVVTVTGVARTSILILDPAGRNTGDRLVVVLLTASLTPDILYDFRNATAGGTQLLPANFPTALYRTDDTTAQATFEFFIQAGAWKYMRSQIPA